jgi:hypothetical protein
MTTTSVAAGRTPVPGRSPTVRLLAAPAPDLATHVATHGPLPALGGAQLVALLQASGLAGRGGAGFPTWRKLADVPATGSTVVVANGAEGEPASSKDLVLMVDAPHLVLDGLEVAGAALGARELHLYARADALHAVRTALAERPGLRVILTEAPETFISGEESAVVRALAGGPAVPYDRATRITRGGLGGAPTLVQNVETLAHLALAARHGAAWFRTVGPADDPGTRLVTLSGDVAHPGVLEVASGTNLAALLRDAGTDPTTVRAVLVGGYHGAWVPGPELARTELSVASLRRFGAAPGAGIVHTCSVSSAAGSPLPRRSPPGSGSSPPASAARASTVCPPWPPPSPGWRAAARTRSSPARSAASPRWSPGAAPAVIPTVPPAWWPAPCAPSATTSACTGRAAARPPRGSSGERPPHHPDPPARRLDPVRRSGPVHRAAAPRPDP